MSKSQKGRKHPEEVKEKIRQANIGENNPAYGNGDRQMGENNPMWGKASKNRRPVQQLTKDGVLVREYEFLSQVKSYGFDISNVTSVCRGRFKSCGGFIWKYK